MRKRTAVRIITFLSAAVIVAGTMYCMTAKRAKSLEFYARTGTQRAFDELVTSVTELSNALDKSVYVTDPALESALCTQIFGRAATAQQAVGALPWSSQELERMSGFLSRVGDYACTLSRTVGSNDGYTGAELQNLRDLADTAEVMRLNLEDMQARMLDGALTMDEVYSAAESLESGDGAAPLAGTALRSIEAEFPELPALIYDGPFSASMLESKPLFLEGLPEVSETEACETAAAFLDVSPSELTLAGDLGGVIPCRCFTALTEGGEYTVYVTKQGGVVLSALCSRLPGRQKLQVQDALNRAEAFVSRLGLEGLKESYHMAQDGVVTVNYEYAQNGVLCYPDLVKVGIALDDGALMSYDARGYISCHTVRELPQAAVTEREARLTVSPALAVQEHRLCIIPSPGGEERLCHEFVCRSADEERYIVYVNAVSGAQEKILILLEDDSGTLTV